MATPFYPSGGRGKALCWADGSPASEDSPGHAIASYRDVLLRVSPVRDLVQASPPAPTCTRTSTRAQPQAPAPHRSVHDRLSPREEPCGRRPARCRGRTELILGLPLGCQEFGPRRRDSRLNRVAHERPHCHWGSSAPSPPLSATPTDSLRCWQSDPVSPPPTAGPEGKAASGAIGGGWGTLLLTGAGRLLPQLPLGEPSALAVQAANSMLLLPRVLACREGLQAPADRCLFVLERSRKSGARSCARVRRPSRRC